MYAFRRSGSKVEDDVEAGTLYPGLSYGDSELRWGFIRKVYGILTAQLLLTTLVSAVVVFYSPINQALKDSPSLLLGFSFLPLILMFPLYIYQQKHPLNFIFLGLFTTFLSLSVGVACANTQGEIVLEALILTSTVVFSLTGYTFWTVKKGKDFSYLGPILFSGLVLLIVTGLIQVSLATGSLLGPSFVAKESSVVHISFWLSKAFFPLGSAAVALCGGFGALLFSAYIVYDTDNLIKRFNYDEYIWASVVLYLDILNLFISILRVLRGSDQ